MSEIRDGYSSQSDALFWRVRYVVDSVYAVHEFEYRLSKGDRPARSGAPGDRAVGPRGPPGAPADPARNPTTARADVLHAGVKPSASLSDK